MSASSRRLSTTHAGAALLAALLPSAGCGGGLLGNGGGGAWPAVVERQEIHLASKEGGRVAEVLAREGEVVKAGAVLLRLDAPELDAQVAEATARAEESRANLESLEKGPREEEIREARAAAEAGEARVRLAEVTQKRVEALWKEALATDQDGDAARANLDLARGEAGVARARLDLLLAGTRAEDLAAARARLAALEASLRLLAARRAETEIRAPSDALLELLPVRPGDVLAPGAPAARLLSAEDLWVKAFVPEPELGRVKVGDAVEVTLDTFPGKAFPGAVRQISGRGEFTPRNLQTLDERRHQVFAVRVRIESGAESFHAGMSAVVRPREGAGP